MARSNPIRGMTLSEVVVALGSGTVMLGALLALTTSVRSASVDIQSALGVVQRGVDVLAELRRDLGRAQIVAIAPDGSQLSYRLPVVDDDSGAFLDAAGDVLWGINDGDGAHLGEFGVISFTTDRIRYETVEGIDINGDGDQSDSFEEGFLRRVSSTGAPMGCPSLRVLLVNGDYSGDVDGDGTGDPLFSMVGDTVVEIRVARVVMGRGVRMSVLRCAVKESEVAGG